RVPVGTYRVIVKSKAGRYVNFGEEFFVPADPDNTVHPKIIYVAHQALPLTLPNVLWDAPQSAWKWGGVPGRWGNKGWNRLKTQPGLKNKALGLGQGLFGYLGAGIFGAAGLGLGSELGLFTRGFNKWYTGLAKRPHGLKPGWDWLEEQVNKRKEEKDDEK
ncbi:MAG: hypothetical protein KKF44_00785, partial [Nanoarchaeota archaeon]|nr:hypothetical protein [Nanoarchaeota archaeon]